ncbi:acyl-CoA dehydrogenase [SAR202 cluster bacterium AD-802-E10_MRT_200m]|nr:acyl-CoA dehydrogenase [SAR202 cluster bacterium AD-802-E10_MRT_200m]
MDLGLNEPQQMLQNSARQFLLVESSSDYVREMETDTKGYTIEMWKKLAELGWFGLPFPEEFGGAGGDFLDVCILLGEMGRTLLPGPFFSSVVLAGLTILDVGSEVQKREFLPGIASGELIATMALTEASGRWDATGITNVKGIRRGGEFVLNGTKLFVENAHVADYLLVAVRTRTTVNLEKGITFLIVPTNGQGMHRTMLKTIGSDRQCEISFNNVHVPITSVLGEIGEGWTIAQRALQRAATAKSCEMVGAIEKVLEMTVDYVKERIQFGRPIGSFQAIQHHCANMAIDVQASRYIAYQAAWTLAHEWESASKVSTAKSWVSDASKRVCELAHQCHGAIGFTKEYDLQLYTRRIRAGELLYGDAEFHKEIAATSMGI